MNDQQKRNAVRDAYAGLKWKAKVDKMSDKQVVALYLKFKSQNKI